MYLKHKGGYSSHIFSQHGLVDMYRPLIFKLSVLLLMTTLLWVNPPPAQAELPEIEASYTAGKKALKGGQFDTALKEFKEALELSAGDEGRTWQMLLAIALTYRESKAPQYAIEYYRRFLKQTEGDLELMPVKWKERRKRASSDLADLERAVEATHGFVSIVTTPKGAEVFIDGERGGADGDAQSPHATILPAGQHTIRVSLKGHIESTQKVSVRAGGAHPLKFTLAPMESTLKAQSEASPSVSPAAQSAQEQSALSASLSLDKEPSTLGPWLTIGAAGAMAAAGVAMTVLASEENKTIERINSGGNPYNFEAGTQLAEDWNAANESLKTYQTTASFLYGLSLAAAAGGIVWLLLAEPEAPSTTLSLTPTPGGAYGHATWSF